MAAQALKEEANALFKAQQYQDAIEKYSAAIELDSSVHTFFSNRAACHIELEKKEWGESRTTHIQLGLESARKCFELEPTFLRGIVRLAQLSWLAAKEADKQKRDAERDAERSEVPSDGKGNRAQGSFDLVPLCEECERACRAGLSIDASNLLIRTTLQELRDCEEYTTNAEADAEIVDADTALVHKAEGNKFFPAKDYDKAETAFTQAMSFNPCDHVFYSNRSACRSSTFHFEKAVADANRCIALKSDWPKGYNRRAVALYGQGNYMEAEAACNEGLVLDPSNAGLLDMLATCKLETCETPEVQAQLAKMRQEARSQDQLNELLSKMGGGGQGGPQVFNMSNLNASGGGLQDLLSGMGGAGMGGLGGGGKPKMSDAQMRQMARAMTSGGPLPTFPPPSPPSGDAHGHGHGHSHGGAPCGGHGH